MKDIINNLNKSDTWKIELTMEINFVSFKDTDEEQVMHSKSDNIEIVINDELDEQIFDFKILKSLNKNLDQKIHLLDRKKLTMTKKK